MKRIDPVLKEQARFLRRNATWHEKELWECLRESKLGVRFRRQHPIGQYIVDFAASLPRIVIEIDGWTHSDMTAEAVRDEELRGLGWAVLHFTNGDVGHRIEWVVEMIRDEIALRLPRGGPIDRSKSTGRR